MLFLKVNTFCSTAYQRLPPTIDAFFRDDLRQFFSTGDDEKIGEDLFESELRYLTFRFSCQLTLLHGMERAKMARLEEREKLTVHVVGARAAESDDLTRWEVLVARLPKLKQLTVVLVGPELR